MKYTVIWRPRALEELAEIWLRSGARLDVNRAVQRMDAYLQQGSGNPHWEGTRIIISPQLIALSEIDPQDRMARVLPVAIRPTSRGS
jgi:hypothetical protein